MIKAELVSGDFEENTMTFEIEGEMILKSGKYVIMPCPKIETLKQTILEKFITWRNAKPKVKKTEMITIDEINTFLNGC